MTVRDITVIGHRALHQPTKKVREVTDEVRELVADMFDTMEAAEGVGLAANQVGVRLRIFVYDCPVPGAENAKGVVINPVLERLGAPAPLDEEEDGEGCLSVPGEYFPLARHPQARVTGIDLDGNEVVIEGEGLLARCLQHETDHLDGLLYVDRLIGPVKREAREAAKDRGWAEHGVTKWDPTTTKAEDV
ncbi:peptide deformylase [Ornithinimicrobium ciconiae]|uniref:Peptide deformylase n=1 Tax=Ornithinimicrobium ciconiae TaxID=2594265 RepID=A0A516G7F9_9MICO|nr:peptide deformylase [Ornithinimicrobium ciconiae]QDO87422.1 peptide deformylase [Ornithinimicrobium ciconiae]